MGTRERVYKSTAVVLRRADFGEADYLLTLYSSEHGKLRALAKGARKPTTRKTGQLELYTLVHLILHRGRELALIAQAETLRPFINIQSDLERSVYAGHFAELIDQFTYEHEDNLPAYNLLVAGLGWLDAPDTHLKLAARYFEYRLLRVMGFEPSVFECAIGGEALEAEDAFFSPTDGGVVCAAHALPGEMMRLSLPTFKILRHFSRTPWDTLKTLQLSPTQAADVERILHTYLTYLLERRLQSASFLRQLERDLPK